MLETVTAAFPSWTSWPVICMMFLSSLVSYVPWSMVFLVTPLVGFRLYTVENAEDCKRVQKRVNKWCTHYTEDDKGHGYSVGKWYFLHIQLHHNAYGDRYSVWCLATEASFRSLMKRDGTPLVATDQEEEVVTEPIRVYERTGSYQNMYFYKRDLPTTILPSARGAQKRIIHMIEKLLREKSRVVAFVHGPPGAGKSMVGLLLAQHLSGRFCNTLRPWQPGDQLCDLFNEVEPTADHPLVIVFDEVDRVLLKIHAEAIPPHAKIPISVMNKVGWNRMLDEIDWGLYPHVVLIMTSNHPPEYVQKLDRSYLRPGRVHVVEYLGGSKRG